MFEGKSFSFIDDFAVSFFNMAGYQDICPKYFRLASGFRASLLVKNTGLLETQMYNVILYHQNKLEKIESIVISNRLAVYMFFSKRITPSALKNAFLVNECPDGHKAIALLMKGNLEVLLAYVVNEPDLEKHHDAQVFFTHDGVKKSRTWKFSYR